jgi:type IV secretory pathway TrbF-like protein
MRTSGEMLKDVIQDMRSVCTDPYAERQAVRGLQKTHKLMEAEKAFLEAYETYTQHYDEPYQSDVDEKWEHLQAVRKELGVE